MNSSGGKLATVEEMANVLGVPKSWIYQRTCQGQAAIPHIKIGKYLRFDIEAVIAHFRKNDSDASKIKGWNTQGGEHDDL